MVAQELQLKTLRQEVEKLTSEAEQQRLELTEKEAQLRDVQQQLSHELAQQVQLLCLTEDKDKQLHEMNCRMEDTDVLQNQVLQKTRENFDLQFQLCQELSERQKVQYKTIELVKAIHVLRMRLQAYESHSITETETSFVVSAAAPMGIPGEGVGDGTCHDFEVEGRALPWEPDGEASPCPPGAHSLLSSMLRAPQ
jgi:hypothetical protein